ncbi:hypothetical protein CBA19CS22_39675 [Caballeronia novacaledonica]|uniref:Uncharacterized protein n=1 Tax=Caballeronia novacaledonica TaxID=1544861 RepID=A0ACB5R615_9BURK|nr:hypothetical protein CBA19CS22_39675 [Caballeronia novacaledonica]
MSTATYDPGSSACSCAPHTNTRRPASSVSKAGRYKVRTHRADAPQRRSPTPQLQVDPSLQPRQPQRGAHSPSWPAHRTLSAASQKGIDLPPQQARRSSAVRVTSPSNRTTGGLRVAFSDDESWF